MHGLSLVIVFLSSVTLGQSLALGTRLSPAQLSGTRTTHCATRPSQIWSCANLVVGGAKFKVGYNAKTRVVKYLFTEDGNFKTNEGLNVGSWIEARQHELVLVPGWRIYGPRTKDGWRTVIGTPFRFNNQTEKLELSGRVRFEDGRAIDLSKPGREPARNGKVKILGFEKGGAVR
jgi:hypothetical protein